MIDRDEHKERVRAANDIVEVIGESVQLKRAGREYVGPCPFHEDRTPSFYVNQEKGCFHCWGCGAKGDVFEFVTLANGVSFREALELLERRGGVAQAPLPRPPVEAKRTYPPQGEVIQAWESSSSVSGDDEACAWCFLRGLDHTILADRSELARVLPDGPLPDWAALGTKGWKESGYRLVVPLYDEAGQMLSLHARYTGTHPTDKKSLFARGFASSGLIMADGWGRLMLAGELEPSVIWICEGIPDFLTATLFYGDANEDSAVLGVFSGSWAPAIAARIPDGTRVVIATDNDPTGEGYQADIIRTLGGRVSLARWTPQEVAS